MSGHRENDGGMDGKEVIVMAVCPKTGKRGVSLNVLLIAFALGVILGFIVNHF